MPQHVLDALAAAPVERGDGAGPPRARPRPRSPPRSCASSASMAGATVLVDPADLELGPATEERAAADRNVSPQPRPSCAAGSTTSPSRARCGCGCASSAGRSGSLGDDRVTGVEVERTAVDGEGRAMGTGELEVLPADLVVRSVGYRGMPAARPAGRRAGGTVPTTTGRVLRDGAASARRVRGRAGSSAARPASSAPTSTTPARRSPRCSPTRPTGRWPSAAARSTTWSTSCGPRGASRCCSTTGGRSTPPRSRSAPPAAGRAPPCTSARRCWPPSGPPPPGRPTGRGGSGDRVEQRAGQRLVGGGDEADLRAPVSGCSITGAPSAVRAAPPAASEDGQPAGHVVHVRAGAVDVVPGGGRRRRRPGTGRPPCTR